MTRLRLSLAVAAVLVALIGGPIWSQEQVVPVSYGDGIGFIDKFDAGRNMVSLGKQSIRLTAEAASSLQRQLTDQGRAANSRFAAKFNVVRGLDGGPAIESIFVFPKKK